MTRGKWLRAFCSRDNVEIRRRVYNARPPFHFELECPYCLEKRPALLQVVRDVVLTES